MSGHGSGNLNYQKINDLKVLPTYQIFTKNDNSNKREQPASSSPIVSQLPPTWRSEIQVSRWGNPAVFLKKRNKREPKQGFLKGDSNFTLPNTYVKVELAAFPVSHNHPKFPKY